MTKALRPLFKTHGGKFYLASHIISLFPKNYEQMHYIEPFCGGCSVLLNKKQSIKEIINDADPAICNIFNCLKSNPEEFINKVNGIQYTEESFNEAIKGNKLGLDGAINELVSRRMSRGGLKKNFSWSERLRGGQPGEVNSWETFKAQLPTIKERLKNVGVYCYNGTDIIKEMDGDNVLFYCDPPYLPSLRTVKKAYAVEMTEKDHIVLADTLNKVKGKVLLSGYYSSLYSKMYKGWSMEVKEMANHSSQAKNKERRIECLWMNY